MNPVRVLKILTGFFHKVLFIPSVNFASPEGGQIKQRWVTELGVRKPCPRIRQLAQKEGNAELRL
ncbi:hypothetical protein A4D02_13360 [Niastella koreensis]|uniref:Uncharacterized protein n=1 Tax=Niastella koreensis TaxID=354356 RepID=A0ABX3NQE0_9BACT|nr:hypothetical protein A4D02_13360 [Niastella koreensis]